MLSFALYMKGRPKQTVLNIIIFKDFYFFSCFEVLIVVRRTIGLVRDYMYIFEFTWFYLGFLICHAHTTNTIRKTLVKYLKSLTEKIFTITFDNCTPNDIDVDILLEKLQPSKPILGGFFCIINVVHIFWIWLFKFRWFENN